MFPVAAVITTMVGLSRKFAALVMTINPEAGDRRPIVVAFGLIACERGRIDKIR